MSSSECQVEDVTVLGEEIECCSASLDGVHDDRGCLNDWAVSSSPSCQLLKLKIVCDH